eukprot:7030378-Pyramimonas_sp.AAC.1
MTSEDADDAADIFDNTSRHVGRHGFGEQNSRGSWLRHWAAQEGLVIANPFFVASQCKSKSLIAVATITSSSTTYY